MNAAFPRAPAPELETLLAVSPDAYPQAVDLVRNLVLVIRMDARAYGAASFLDDRVLGPATQGAWLPAAAVTRAARLATAIKPLHFIFHTGHVGSTLLSRLLDETGVGLGLREPMPLRTLADAHDVLGRPESLLALGQFHGLMDMLLRLWSRGYASTQAVTVKATSSAGRIAPQLLARSTASRAVYMSLHAEPYLATLLGGANSAIDLRGHGPGRMRRLLEGGELPVSPLHTFSPGELAALGWLVETMARNRLSAAHGPRVLALDFDEFLTDVSGSLSRVLSHFRLALDEAALESLARSPVLGQYSKAPHLSFPPGERAARLAESRHENGAEIAKGLAWLERLAREDSRIAAALSREAA
jgi:hypothetical protein